MDNQPPSSQAPTPASVTPVPHAPVGITPSVPGAVLPAGGPFSSKTGGFKGAGAAGPSTVMFALIGILGLGTVGFGIAAVLAYSKASIATTTLNQQKAAAAVTAKKEQKKDDDQANLIASESPFRSYVAPVDFGSFEIKFPKNWSGYVDQEQIGTQVSLVINPDFISRSNGADELVAGRVQLIERTKDSYLQQYTSLIKRNTLKQADITVSGLKGYDITGTFADKKTTRQVIVPVRDKVLVFTNENSKYSNEFNQILAQANIIP
jgi:hypothetical protein